MSVKPMIFPRSRLLCLWPLVLVLCLSPVSANEESAPTDALLEFVGLSAQIKRSAATIIDETLGARVSCNDEDPHQQALVDFLDTLYASESLRVSARELVDASLTSHEKTELLDWMQSPLGQKVYQAEASTEDQDLDTMAKRERALVDSAAWTDKRQKHIYRVLRVTRVHDYVAALNASLTSVVKMASSCQTDSAVLDAVEASNRRDRADEKLIGRMMLPGFVVPTGVVFESLSDDELHEYFLFSSTPVAQKWYVVVIDTVRSLLLDRVPQIRQYLQHE